MPYRPCDIEPAWQRYWDEHQTFVATEDPTRKKFYSLDMFPYPSELGLHMGHPASYIAGDVVSRLRRAQGYNVLHPMGYDSFGLPAEQKAIEQGTPPQELTAAAIVNFKRQLKMLGFSYDWSREVSTCDPAYYKWTQYIFTVLHERGLAYQDEMYVNWCPALGTVLANDEVIDGRSERGNHPVERRRMRQWMLRITAFADRLLEGLERIDWPESTKVKQREWIGRSDGAEITFAIAGRAETIQVFTTRPDTLWGATYLVLAPEHPLVAQIATEARRDDVEAYQRRTAAMLEVDRHRANRTKTGADTGARAIHPATGAEIPIWIADYVLHGYGTGAIMAVPAHDERDGAFAAAMQLPVVEVIRDGALVNSGELDGTPAEAAVKAAIAWLERRGCGRGIVQYRMRDWIFARQRYWGEPIPVLAKDGAVVRTLGVDELPLTLPILDNYAPSGTGESPLASATSWCTVDDPVTGQTLQRETATMPGSAGSSWYFLRYCDPHNAAMFAARDKLDYWMPVDLYVGGDEHAVGHLLYARMWQKALCDAGLVRDDEPFAKLRHNGKILAFTYYEPDSDRVVPTADVELRGDKAYRRGTDVELTRTVEKMAKRKKNVVNPDDVVRQYGADAVRVYLCFLGPLEADKPWAPAGIEAMTTWLQRVWRLFFDEEDRPRSDDREPSEAELRVLHRAIAKVTDDIERLHLNTAISALHVATRDFAQLETRSRAVLAPFAQLLQPFAPHLAEELWSRALGREGGITFVPWPVADPQYATDDVVAIGVQVGGKTRGEIRISRTADEPTAVAAARACPDVAAFLGDRAIERVVYKPGRILSLIVR